MRGLAAFGLAAMLVLSGCAGFVRDRIYKPVPAQSGLIEWPIPAPQAIRVTTADGLELSGYYWAPENGHSDLIVYFHGNGFNQLVASFRAAPLVGDGHGVLIASYRGYGGNPGHPSEKGLFADGDAWMAKARALAGDGKFYVFGHSLGGAVALEMAARHPVDGVATLGAFTRLADVAPGITRPFLPDRYDNRAAIARVTAPVYLFHGTADETVPYPMAAKLRTASGDRAAVIPLPGGHHQVDMTRLAPLVWAALERGNLPESAIR